MRTVAGLKVRPTSDRLRETLFNVVAGLVHDSRVLDICAGSGAVGIEALSRGAREATFIERSRPAVAVIEANLKSLALTSATIINRDAPASLKRLDNEGRQFDIVFFDPPYASEIYADVMKYLGSGNLVAADGIVIVEHRAKTPPDPQFEKLRPFREIRQGESALSFYEISTT